MALAKLQIKAGINREGTNYSNDNGWYQSNNVRFRSGLPEKIGGWVKRDTDTYLGTARALWSWVDYASSNYLGIGTNLKYYISLGGTYYDITPIRATFTSPTTNNCFASVNGSTTVIVTIVAHGATNGDFVTFTGAVGFGGISATKLNTQFQITYLSTNTFSITVASAATSTATGGGTGITAAFQMITGLAIYSVGTGWGAGPWGRGGWGSAYTGGGIGEQLLLWSNDNFGQDLILAVRGGPLYIWLDSTGVNVRAVYLSAKANAAPSTVTGATFSSGVTSITVPFPAGIVGGSYVSGTGIPANTYVAYSYTVGSSTVPISNATTSTSTGNYTFTYSGGYVPTATNAVSCSSVQQFVIAFGANSYTPGTPNSTFDPMLVRWSDQANPYQWVPDVTNQAGEYRLSHGSFIMTAQVTRQENLIWTDTSLYSMQYIGAPYVWGIQMLMDNISIMSPNAAITANGATFWMGIDKFYMYNGTVNTLPCTLKQFVFSDINLSQAFQVFAGGNFGYNEVWWYYCSESSNIIDSYVAYNYVEQTWFSGSMTRTAWLDSSLQPAPVAASYLPLAGFQGAISGTTLTVSQVYYGTIPLNTIFTGMGIITGTVITSQISGVTGGAGTYIVNFTQTVTSTSMEITTTNNGLLLNHETGVDNLSGSASVPIDAYIQSSDIDLEDGQHFGFIWRILPDINFNGSNINNPYVTMTVWPRLNSGAPYGTADAPTVTSANNYAPPYPPNSSVYIVQQYTGQIYTRLRGRQMSFRVESNALGTAWQLGAPRVDIKPDGRR